jgi:hypothetical protein
MEKSSKKLDRITRQIIKMGGLHQPSTDFMENVMESVSKIESEKFCYTPLISKKVWIILLLLILALTTYLFLFTNVDFALLENMLLFEKIAAFDLSLPEIKLSREMIYGIGFLGLFLLQIPLLKRQLDRVEY